MRTRKHDWASRQQKLPQLPLPPLTDTISRYLETLAPLVDSDALAAETTKAHSFVAGEGAELQRQVQRLDAATPDTSYVKPFWDTMYLAGRYPLPINSNPFVAFMPSILRRTQAERAASLVYHMLKWRQAMDDGLLAPDGTADTPFCMDEYSRLFGTARIPGQGVDTTQTHADSCHIVVLRGAALFKLNVVDPTTGAIVPERMLLRELEALLVSTEHHCGPSIASLTSLDRGIWAARRARLLQRSASAVNTVDSALLVCCLDFTGPDTRGALYESYLHGGNHDEKRWWDKLSLIVTPKSDACVNFEHSPYDGSTVIRMMNDVWGDAEGMRPLLVGAGATARETTAVDPAPTQLKIVLDDALRRTIADAERQFATLRSRTRVSALHFQEFGAVEIKRWGIGSPESVMQLAFQISHCRIHGRTDISGYSAASTKRFLHGRTEAIRTTSRESAALAAAMSEKRWLGAAATAAAAGIPISSKGAVQLLRAAATRTMELAQEAASGRGVDRHLLALRGVAVASAAQGKPLPDFFGEAYAKHQTSVLSTSNCSAFGPSIVTPGFGAVCPLGYGLGYVVKAGCIDACITNFTADPSTGGMGFGGVPRDSSAAAAAAADIFDRDADRFGRELATVLDELRQLCVSQQAVRPKL